MYGMINQNTGYLKSRVGNIKIFHSQPLDYVKINLASPSLIRSWGERKCFNGRIIGEVTNPSTIHYKIFRPIIGGIFCEQIFGPITAFVCACGYLDSIEREAICPTCLVKKTSIQMRRIQMGIIDLLVPITHIWYVRGRVNKIAHILGENSKELESNIYFEVIDKFSMQGCSLILQQLKKINLEYDAENIRIELSEKDEKGKFVTRRKDRRLFIKQLKVINQFKGSGSKPSWMILEVVSILPPELRPFLELQIGGFIFSDINELYRNLLMRTRRYKMFKILWNQKDYNIPISIQQSGARLIQESVDMLIQNGKHGHPVITKQTKIPLKSLTDIIQGKEGRLRRNLLGKRVDYSGRSVVVSGHNLNSSECGLPLIMGLELFRPFMLHFLINYLRWDPPLDLRQARVLLDGALGSRMFNNKDFSKPDDCFEKLILKGSTIDFPIIISNLVLKHMVLLNRAPTLHRYGFQAFTPVIVLGKALQLPLPLCVGFNADFDGDQMGVHLPLSLEAQLEAAWIMASPENLMSCSNSHDYMQSVTQEAVLGTYCASMNLLNRLTHVFSKPVDVSYAMSSGYVNHFTSILLRNFIYSSSGLTYKYIQTTVGRVLCHKDLFN
uniref:DNA-directed RNA polymerase subunit n=1 Tax=Karlodinium veneficum TaxID=407301 RepID=G1E797_KARVE|nr:beta' subunit of RNA polymerase [Karlodinium veneficum]